MTIIVTTTEYIDFLILINGAPLLIIVMILSILYGLKKYQEVKQNAN